MGRLLGGPGWGAERRRPRTDLAGRLDPLTLAMYQWRVASNVYDSPDVLDALANRLAAEAVSPAPLGGVEWSGPGG